MRLRLAWHRDKKREKRRICKKRNVRREPFSTLEKRAVCAGRNSVEIPLSRRIRVPSRIENANAARDREGVARRRQFVADNCISRCSGMQRERVSLAVGATEHPEPVQDFRLVGYTRAPPPWPLSLPLCPFKLPSIMPRSCAAPAINCDIADDHVT